MRQICCILLFMTAFIVKGNNSEKYIKVGTRSYQYNSKNLCIEKQSYDVSNNLISYAKYLYDDQGNKIGTLKYNADSTLLARYIYVYKDTLKVKTIKVDYRKDEETSREFTYNDELQCVHTMYINNGKTIKSIKTNYTPKGESFRKQYFNGTNELTRDLYFKYTYSNNRIVKKSKFSQDDKLLTQSLYEYNKKGHKHIYYLNYASGKKKSKKRVYHYNDKGLHISTDVFELCP